MEKKGNENLIVTICDKCGTVNNFEETIRYLFSSFICHHCESLLEIPDLPDTSVLVEKVERGIDMSNKNHSIDEMIRLAAVEANIEIEQSRECIHSAFKYIQMATQKNGYFDLSNVGFPGVYARKDIKITKYLT